MVMMNFVNSVAKEVAALLTAAGLLVALPATAAPVLPVSYDMNNGHDFASGGSFNYWVRDYTGTGSVPPTGAPHANDGEFLTGGLGDLTDGIIPTQDWFLVENLSGAGTYVGWRNFDPTITFNFGASVAIDTVTLYLADTNNGGVAPPGSVDIDGTNYAISDPAGTDPFSVSFSGLGFLGTSMSIQLFRSDQWVFISEVTFADAQPGPVSAPGGVLLLAGAVQGIGVLRRRWLIR